MNETERFLTSAELAELSRLVAEIQADPSPTAAAKRAGVAFEYPSDLRGAVVSLKLPSNPEHVGFVAIVFDWKPCCSVPPSRLRKIDEALLRATVAVDDAAAELTEPTESTRRETIRILKALNRALIRAANLANRLSHTPPAAPLPWSTAGAVFWVERAA